MSALYTIGIFLSTCWLLYLYSKIYSNSSQTISVGLLWRPGHQKFEINIEWIFYCVRFSFKSQLMIAYSKIPATSYMGSQRGELHIKKISAFRPGPVSRKAGMMQVASFPWSTNCDVYCWSTCWLFNKNIFHRSGI